MGEATEWGQTFQLEGDVGRDVIYVIQDIRYLYTYIYILSSNDLRQVGDRWLFHFSQVINFFPIFFDKKISQVISPNARHHKV